MMFFDTTTDGIMLYRTGEEVEDCILDVRLKHRATIHKWIRDNHIVEVYGPFNGRSDAARYMMSDNESAVFLLKFNDTGYAMF